MLRLLLNKLWLSIFTKSSGTFVKSYTRHRTLFWGHKQIITRLKDGTYSVSTYDGTTKLATFIVKDLFLWT